MNYLLIGGLLLNSVLILINRYVKHLPDFVYIPLMIICIACMIAGAFLARR